MKKLTQIISYTFAVLVLTLAPKLSVAAEQTTVSGTTLELNGLGVHSELRNEWFLNGLYLVKRMTQMKLLTHPVLKGWRLRFLLTTYQADA